MAHGENHAKQTVLNQAKALEDKLSNGHLSDPLTHGEALLLQMVKPIFSASLMTVEECDERMAKCPGTTKHRFGWPAALTTCVTILGLLITILKLAGKM